MKIEIRHSSTQIWYMNTKYQSQLGDGVVSLNLLLLVMIKVQY